MTSATPTTTPDRLAAHGHRRCGIAQYDHQAAPNDKVSAALAMIVDYHLGPLHPGYTTSEVHELSLHRRGQPAINEATRDCALALRDNKFSYAYRRFGVAA